MVPFLESDCNYSSAKVHTYRIYDKTNFYQAKVSPNSSTNDMGTWFFTDSPYDPLNGTGHAAIFFDGRPWFPTAAGRGYLGQTNWGATTSTLVPGTSIDNSFSLGITPTTANTTGRCVDYAVTTFKQCKVPIAYLSDLFMQDSQIFYANAVNMSWITLQLKF